MLWFAFAPTDRALFAELSARNVVVHAKNPACRSALSSS